MPFDASTGQARIQVLSVFLDEQVFGIPIPRIQDVLRPLQLTAVPLAPAYIEGVSNLRGRIVTAISLRRRIYEGGACAAQECMNVVLENNGELYSILVDRVGDVLMIDAADVEEPPATLNAVWRDFSQGVCQLDNAIMIILDADRVVQPAGERG